MPQARAYCPWRPLRAEIDSEARYRTLIKCILFKHLNLYTTVYIILCNENRCYKVVIDVSMLLFNIYVQKLFLTGRALIIHFSFYTKHTNTHKKFLLIHIYTRCCKKIKAQHLIKNLIPNKVEENNSIIFLISIEKKLGKKCKKNLARYTFL